MVLNVIFYVIVLMSWYRISIDETAKMSAAVIFRKITANLYNVNTVIINMKQRHIYLEITHQSTLNILGYDTKRPWFEWMHSYVIESAARFNISKKVARENVCYLILLLEYERTDLKLIIVARSLIGRGIFISCAIISYTF